MFAIIESYLRNENKTDLNIRIPSFFYFIECFLPFLMVKKSTLFCLFPFPGGFYKVKPILLWLVSTMPCLLILLQALTCPKGDVVANVIISR